MNKTVLITGVSRKVGIGASMAIRLASVGYNIFTTYYRPYDQDMPEWKKDDTDIQVIEREISKFPVKFSSYECDLSDITQIAKIFDTVKKEIGPVYGLINNACFSIDTNIDSLTAELIDKHYYINVRAPMLLSQEFVKRYRQNKNYSQGRIITLTSGYVTEPNPGNLAYSATKVAMNRFTNSLSLEVAGLGITVNSVDPGATDTSWMSRELKSEILENAPMKRLGQPMDVANLIEFLISEKAQWITGQIIHSRGGL